MNCRADLVEGVVGAVRAVVEEHDRAGAHPLGEPDRVVDGGVAVVDGPGSLVLEELGVVDEQSTPASAASASSDTPSSGAWSGT